jgi:DNA polymerase
MPAPKDLPETMTMLSRRNAFELSHARFSADVQKLVEVIQDGMTPKGATKPESTSVIVRQKAAALKQIRDDLVNATASPLYQFRVENKYFPVLGDGNPDANIMFIGEAPGKAEVETGVPFVGPSGEVLDEMLASINLKRADVYLTNMLLDRPPDNRDPSPEELAFYATFVDRLIDVIQPKVIVTLGRFAMQHIFKKLDLPEKRGKISDLHGKLIKAHMAYGEIHIVPLYHPAVVLYSATQRETLHKDFQKLKLFI